jgi:hypothetical protein
MAAEPRGRPGGGGAKSGLTPIRRSLLIANEQRMVTTTLARLVTGYLNVAAWPCSAHQVKVLQVSVLECEELDSGLGASPQGFESPILRHADLRERCLGCPGSSKARLLSLSLSRGRHGRDLPPDWTTAGGRRGRPPRDGSGRSRGGPPSRVLDHPTIDITVRSGTPRTRSTVAAVWRASCRRPSRTRARRSNAFQA